jgi:predicted transcriptional regulator
MRTTIRIDDELLRQLRQRAERERVSLGEIVNRTLRTGMEAVRRGRADKPKKFRQAVFRMGKPKAQLTKALALAGEMEDRESLRKLLRK